MSLNAVCSFCRGQGNVTCDRCDGHGFLVLCLACSGTRVWECDACGSAVDCEECLGSGVHSLPLKDRGGIDDKDTGQCEQCWGSGGCTCPECLGRGVRPKEA